MKRIILAMLFMGMFVMPTSAGESYKEITIMLKCTPEDTNNKIISIIINLNDNAAIMITQHNNIITGNLAISEYFYTITIDKHPTDNKSGVFKINRLSGVLSVVWTDTKTENRPFSNVDTQYGTCVYVDYKRIF